MKARSRGGGEIERRWSRSLLDWRGAAIDETGAISAVLRSRKKEIGCAIAGVGVRRAGAGVRSRRC